MGHDLYRMIRDGAPPSWTPNMRLLAETIADDAFDADQVNPGAPWGRSKIRVRGGWSDDGRWYDGLTERTGLSERSVSRTLGDLGQAGFEMREQVTDRRGRPVTDTSGRPVFACNGHALEFRVPILTPRSPPDLVTFTDGSPPDVVTFTGGDMPADDGRSSPDLTRSSPDVAAKLARSGDPPTRHLPHYLPDIDPAGVTDGSLEVPGSSPNLATFTTPGHLGINAERRRQLDALERQYPEIAGARHPAAAAEADESSDEEADDDLPF